MRADSEKHQSEVGRSPFRATKGLGSQLEALFTEFVELDGRPSLPQAAGLMRDYRDEYFYLAAIPFRVQRALGAIVRSLMPSAAGG